MRRGTFNTFENTGRPSSGNPPFATTPAEIYVCICTMISVVFIFVSKLYPACNPDIPFCPCLPKRSVAIEPDVRHIEA